MRARVTLLACVLAGLVLPAAADASVTIGSPLNAIDTGAQPPCPGGGCTNWNSAPSNLAEIAPSAGVVVSYSVRTASNQMFRIRILRPGSGSTATVVTSSGFALAPGTNLPVSQAVRLPVQQGDIVALGMTSGERVPAATLAGATYGCFNPTLDEPADGTSASIFPACFSNSELLYNATIEPDVDGDGYGDETQDGCPSDPTIQTVCAPDVALSGSLQPASVAPGASTTLGLTVANTGTGPASAVSVSVPLPAGLTVGAATASAGTCTAAQTVSCALGTIAAHTSVSVTITIGTSASGTFNFSATAATTGSDANTANNTSPFTLTVASVPGDHTPPVLRGLRLSPRRFRAVPFGGSIARARSTPIATHVSYRLSEAATVTFTVRRAGDRKLPGSFTQSGRGGANHFRFTGRLGGKTLAPGAYQLTAIPRDAAGNHGRSVRVTFQIAAA